MKPVLSTEFICRRLAADAERGPAFTVLSPAGDVLSTGERIPDIETCLDILHEGFKRAEEASRKEPKPESD